MFITRTQAQELINKINSSAINENDKSIVLGLKSILENALETGSKDQIKVNDKAIQTVKTALARAIEIAVPVVETTPAPAKKVKSATRTMGGPGVKQAAAAAIKAMTKKLTDTQKTTKPRKIGDPNKRK